MGNNALIHYLFQNYWCSRIVISTVMYVNSGMQVLIIILELVNSEITLRLSYVRVWLFHTSFIVIE